MALIIPHLQYHFITSDDFFVKGIDLSESGKKTLNPFFTQNSDFEPRLVEPFVHERKNIRFALEPSKSSGYFY